MDPTSNKFVPRDAIKPQNWQEALVAPAIDKQRPETTRNIYKVGLVILAGLFTLSTVGIGYLLVKRISLTFTAYQERVNQAIKTVASPILSSEAGEKALVPADSKKVFDPRSPERIDIDISIRIEDELKKAESIEVPRAFQTLGDNMPLDYTAIRGRLAISPWKPSRENIYQRKLHDIFERRMSSFIAEDESYTGELTREYYISRLAACYRLRATFERVYNDLPSKLDVKDENTFFSVESSDTDRIVFPSIYGAALLSAYYEEKYGIIMHVGTKEGLQRLLDSEACPKEPFGFILFSPDIGVDRWHVTPVVIFPGTKQLLSLDSLAKEEVPITGYESIAPSLPGRQADAASCHNDAVSILSNALWDIKRRGITSMSGLPEITAGHLPAAWAKTVQRSAALAGVDMEGPVRTKRSDKRLSSFIDAHKEGPVRRYLLRKGISYASKIQRLISDSGAHSTVWNKFRERVEMLKRDGFKHLV